MKKKTKRKNKRADIFPFILAREILIINGSDLRFLATDGSGNAEDVDDEDGVANGNDELSKKEKKKL